MMCIEDALDSLKWVESIGGLKAMIERSQNNLNAIIEWEKNTNWVTFLAKNSDTISSTSICLEIIDDWFTNKEIE